MAGYEILPMELDQEIDINVALERGRQMNNPIVDRIIARYQASDECWRLFYRIHQNRKDKSHMGQLGVAKLARAHRDAYAELLQEIVQEQRP